MLLQLTRQRQGFGLRQSHVSIYDRAEKLKIRNDDVAAGEQGDDLLFFELAELSAHRFQRKAKVVRHLGPREGRLKVHIIPLKGAFSGNAPRHHEEEARDALVGTLLPAKQKPPIAAELQLTDRGVKNLALKLGMRFQKLFERGFWVDA